MIVMALDADISPCDGSDFDPDHIDFSGFFKERQERLWSNVVDTCQVIGPDADFKKVLALDSCRPPTAWHYGNRIAAHVKHTIVEHRCNKQHARVTLANWHSRPNTFDMPLPGESTSVKPRTDGDSDSLTRWLRFVADGVSPTYTWCNGWFSVDKRLSWASLTLSRTPS